MSGPPTKEVACFELTSSGIERRQASRDFVGIVKAEALHFVWEEFLREGRFACAVAAGDEVDGGFRYRHSKVRRGKMPRPAGRMPTQPGRDESRLRVELRALFGKLLPLFLHS